MPDALGSAPILLLVSFDNRFRIRDVSQAATLVLNPIMFIPFILIPLILTITSYIALASGLVPKTVAILPWTTPPTGSQSDI